jgi:hypothetical protein
MLDGVNVHGIVSELESKPPKSQKSRKMVGQREDICRLCPPLLGDFSAPRTKLGLSRDGFSKNDEILCEI